MKLIIIRHGQTDGNVKGLVQGAGLDLPLNENGQAQAAAAVDKLQAYQLPVIYSSTMLRARQTAEIIAAGIGCSTAVVEGLEEVHFGEAEGMLSEDAHRGYGDVFEVINNEENPGRFDVSLPGGESINQSTERGMEALCRIAAQNGHAVVGVVTHGALMFNLYYRAFKQMRRFDNCEFFELEL